MPELPDEMRIFQNQLGLRKSIMELRKLREEFSQYSDFLTREFENSGEEMSEEDKEAAAWSEWKRQRTKDESDGEQVNNDRDKSLFDIISKRYVRSAFPELLKLKSQKYETIRTIE